METKNEIKDEFEFRPLTEGLGFHKNAERAAPKVPPPPAPLASTLNKTPPPMTAPIAPRPETRPETRSKPPFVPSLPADYDFKQVAKELTHEPLKRESKPLDTKPRTAATSTAQATAPPRFSIPVPGAPASLSALRASVGVSAPVNRATTFVREKEGLELATSIPAALLDGVFVFGISMILMVIVLAITKVDLFALLSNASTDMFVQMQLGLLYVVVMNMYLLVARSTWFGQSIGEWTYDVQLGTSAQQKTWQYPAQVLWRNLLFTLTGFVIIPILSAIFRRDLAGPVTGLSLQKKEIRDGE